MKWLALFKSIYPVLAKYDVEWIGNHSIFRLDIHRNLTYLCAVTFKNNDYGERKSKLSGGI